MSEADAAYQQGYDRGIASTAAERAALRARVAQLEAALRGHALATMPTGEACYCAGRLGTLSDADFWDAPHDDECLATRAALASACLAMGRCPPS